MLNPCVVGITGRRRSVLPTDIVQQFILSPVGQIERRICHNEICTKISMKVIKKCVSLIRAEVCINATNRHIHLCHLPGICIGFLTINGNALTIAAVCLDELHALNKHTAGATARVIHTAVVERLQDCNDGLNDAGRCIELAALHTFVSSKLCDAILVSSSQKIFAFLCIRHIHIGEQIDDIAQNSLVQIRTCVILRKHIFQRFVFCFNLSHGFIKDCADFRSVSRSCNGRPSCFLWDEENILAQILVTIFFKAFALCNKLVIFSFKCAGNVAKENQSDDYLSIFSGRDMSP